MTVAEPLPTVEASAKVAQAMVDLRNQPTDIQRYMMLRRLQRDNPTLFYKMLVHHVQEILPFVYTPTVGEACQKYHSLGVPTYGIYLRATDRGARGGRN